MRRADVEREVARAHGARRMLPWTLATAAGGAAIALAAGGGARAAVTLLVLGLVFSAFLFTVSVARCPACGARLPRGPKGPGPEGSGPDGTGPVWICPRCAARFG